MTMGFASLEYAVKFLGVPLLMVLGHTNCGAVAAAVKVVKERIELPGHLPELIKSIEPAVIAAHGRHPSDLVAAAIEENVRLNVKRLIDDTPIMSDALAAKKIDVVGGIYDIATGKSRISSETRVLDGGRFGALAVREDRRLSVERGRRREADAKRGAVPQMAEAAEEQAGILAKDLGAVPAFAPSLRPRLTASLVGMFGPRAMRPVLSASKVRGVSVYRGKSSRKAIRGRPRSRRSASATQSLAAARFGPACSASMTGSSPTPAWSWAWPAPRSSPASSC